MGIPKYMDMLDYRVEQLPEHMREAVRDYILEGKRVGYFLQAIFSNNFYEALLKADQENRSALFEYFYLLSSAPFGCFGSEENYERWISIGGLQGLYKKRKENGHN